uniref:Tyr recombinase domain-containing protein n=1 Tax=Amphimedon queenslandica TaxID=400682 RepID=A0A1X7UAY8_AMPQE
LNPPLPRYSSTWDVNFVLTHLNSHRLDANLTLKQLTLRTVMLMALTRPSHSVDLSNLDLTARWLKQVMTAAGIDTIIFKAHSVRSASMSAASTAGVTTEDILNAADWSTESSFSRIYYKPVCNPVFASAILKATNNTIDM